jgi:hypothetical protein
MAAFQADASFDGARCAAVLRDGFCHDSLAGSSEPSKSSVSAEGQQLTVFHLSQRIGSNFAREALTFAGNSMHVLQRFHARALQDGNRGADWLLPRLDCQL